jgi:hypothetical protein
MLMALRPLKSFFPSADARRNSAGAPEEPWRWLPSGKRIETAGGKTASGEGDGPQPHLILLALLPRI